GRASALNPELQDLTSYSNITSIRIYNITDGGGIGWDDFIFTPGLSITSKALLNGTKGSMYSEAVYAAGGIAPYTWSVQSGQLPLGLNLSPAGVLAGTPTTPG